MMRSFASGTNTIRAAASSGGSVISIIAMSCARSSSTPPRAPAGTSSTAAVSSTNVELGDAAGDGHAPMLERDVRGHEPSGQTTAALLLSMRCGSAGTTIARPPAHQSRRLSRWPRCRPEIGLRRQRRDSARPLASPGFGEKRVPPLVGWAPAFTIRAPTAAPAPFPVAAPASVLGGRSPLGLAPRMRRRALNSEDACFATVGSGGATAGDDRAPDPNLPRCNTVAAFVSQRFRNVLLSLRERRAVRAMDRSDEYR